MNAIDKNTLSYWFPRLVAKGLPVPATRIVTMAQDAAQVIWKSFDGEDAPKANLLAFENFLDELRAAAGVVGYPAFLRTGHTSGKHEWAKTCCVKSGDDFAQHVFNLAEHSEIAGFPADLPWGEWVVREMLPSITFGACEYYHQMPIAREFRCFVDGDQVVCIHPYWPRQALEDGKPPPDLDYAALCALTLDQVVTVGSLAKRAGAAVGGKWSVDILDTKIGWYVTDMAEAHRSFHWEDCGDASYFDRPELAH